MVVGVHSTAGSAGQRQSNVTVAMPSSSIDGTSSSHVTLVPRMQEETASDGSAGSSSSSVKVIVIETFPKAYGGVIGAELLANPLQVMHIPSTEGTLADSFGQVLLSVKTNGNVQSSIDSFHSVNFTTECSGLMDYSTQNYTCPFSNHPITRNCSGGAEKGRWIDRCPMLTSICSQLDLSAGGAPMAAAQNASTASSSSLLSCRTVSISDSHIQCACDLPQPPPSSNIPNSSGGGVGSGVSQTVIREGGSGNTIAIAPVFAYFKSDGDATFAASDELLLSASSVDKVRSVLVLWASLWGIVLLVFAIVSLRRVLLEPKRVAPVVALGDILQQQQPAHIGEGGQLVMVEAAAAGAAGLDGAVARIRNRRANLVGLEAARSNDQQQGEHQQQQQQPSQSADIVRLLTSYVDSAIPAVYSSNDRNENGLANTGSSSSSSSLSVAATEKWRAVFKHHGLLSILVQDPSSASAIKTFIACVYLATIQGMLICLVAVLYDFTSPNDDGSCQSHVTQDSCLARTSMLSTQRSYCQWTTTQAPVVGHRILDSSSSAASGSCKYAELQLSTILLFSIILITSSAAIVITIMLDFLFAILKAPTKNDIDMSRVVVAANGNIDEEEGEVRGAVAVARAMGRRASAAMIVARRSVVDTLQHWKRAVISSGMAIARMGSSRVSGRTNTLLVPPSVRGAQDLAHVVLAAMKQSTASRQERIVQLCCRNKAEARRRMLAVRALYQEVRVADADAVLVDIEEPVDSLSQQILLQRYFLEKEDGEEERGRQQQQEENEEREDGSSRIRELFDHQWLLESTAFAAAPPNPPPPHDHQHGRQHKLFQLSADAKACIDSAVGHADRVAERVQEELNGSEDSNIGE